MRMQLLIIISEKGFQCRPPPPEYRNCALERRLREGLSRKKKKYLNTFEEAQIQGPCKQIFQKYNETLSQVCFQVLFVGMAPGSVLSSVTQPTARKSSMVR
jgi:hypothetical protein